jgi:DNA-binding NtrC family response regulator
LEGEKMPTILIVDDKPGVRKVLAEELAFQGYTVMSVGDAALVSEIIKFSKLDLAILDLYVKGHHRWDLFLDIKQQEPRLPVLIVTDSASYRRDPRSALAAGLLVKSFDFDNLLQKIAEVLQRKQVDPNVEASDRRPIPTSPPYFFRKQPCKDAANVLGSSDGKPAMI